MSVLTRAAPRRWNGGFAAPALFAGILGLLLATAPVAADVERGETVEPAESSSVQDEGWLAWVGCWSPLAIDADDPATTDLVCVEMLEGELGATISTVRDGVVIAEHDVRTDGERHPVRESGCEGWEEARWSDDGRRLFLRSEVECGAQVRRITTGIHALGPDGDWIDVQAVQVGDRADTGAGVRRLEPVSPERIREAGLAPFAADRAMAARTARIHATAPLHLDDIAEAVRHVDDEVVKVLLLETESMFDLSSHEIIDLHERGVSEDVIDVLVAVSFPDRFFVDGAQRIGERPVERQQARAADHRMYPSYRLNPFRPFGLRRVYDPLFYDPFYHSGFYSGIYYGSPYAGGFRGRGPIVVVPVQPRSGGRVIQGRGYTRGGASSSQSGGSDGATRTSPPPRTTPSTSSEPSRVSPQGHRGSDREDTGRRARPRGDSSGGSSGSSSGGGGI